VKGGFFHQPEESQRVVISGGGQFRYAWQSTIRLSSPWDAPHRENDLRIDTQLVIRRVKGGEKTWATRKGWLLKSFRGIQGEELPRPRKNRFNFRKENTLYS